MVKATIPFMKTSLRAKQSLLLLPRIESERLCTDETGSRFHTLSLIPRGHPFFKLCLAVTHDAFGTSVHDVELSLIGVQILVTIEVICAVE
jgi:hypothetical protein